MEKIPPFSQETDNTISLSYCIMSMGISRFLLPARSLSSVPQHYRFGHVFWFLLTRHYDKPPESFIHFLYFWLTIEVSRLCRKEKLEKCEAQALAVPRWKKSGQFRSMSPSITKRAKCQYN